MIAFDNFSGPAFVHLGFTFETPEEVELFTRVIRKELEVRVGQAVGRNLSDKQLEEFNLCLDPAESLLWLEDHCPDYREIVRVEQERLESELLEYRDIIPGAMAVPPPELGSIAIEELGLSVHCYNCLKRIGLNTVQDVADHGKLSQFQKLGRRGIEELNAKLWELMDRAI